MFFPRSDALLLSVTEQRTAKWNPLVLYNTQTKNGNDAIYASVLQLIISKNQLKMRQ